MPTRKSPKVQQAVIAKRLQGESKRQIARDLQMGRDTVDRILSESQIEEAVAQGRSRLVELVPRAIQLIGRAIEQGLEADEVPRNALEAAIKVLKGSGAYEERSRTRGDLYVNDGYAKADRGELESQLRDRLQAIGSSRSKIDRKKLVAARASGGKCLKRRVPAALGLTVKQWMDRYLEASLSTTFRKLRLFRELAGVPEEKIMAMPELNATQLCRLPEPARKSEEWVEQATKPPVAEFREKVDSALETRGILREKFGEWCLGRRRT